MRLSTCLKCRNNFYRGDNFIAMVYITGDTHGDQFRFIYSRYEKKWSSEDYIIVLGDFGFIFLNDQTERNFLDDLAARPYTVLFVYGNHEKPSRTQ